jgi:hypothetical protein
MTLREAPGGAQMIESLIEAMKTLSLGYAGTPDEAAKLSLKTFVDNIRPQLTEALGAGTAANLLEAVGQAVMGLKHEIEAVGASRA